MYCLSGSSELPRSANFSLHHHHSIDSSCFWNLGLEAEKHLRTLHCFELWSLDDALVRFLNSWNASLLIEYLHFSHCRKYWIPRELWVVLLGLSWLNVCQTFRWSHILDIPNECYFWHSRSWRKCRARVSNYDLVDWYETTVCRPWQSNSTPSLCQWRRSVLLQRRFWLRLSSVLLMVHVRWWLGLKVDSHSCGWHFNYSYLPEILIGQNH